MNADRAAEVLKKWRSDYNARAEVCAEPFMGGVYEYIASRANAGKHDATFCEEATLTRRTLLMHYQYDDLAGKKYPAPGPGCTREMIQVGVGRKLKAAGYKISFLKNASIMMVVDWEK